MKVNNPGSNYFKGDNYGKWYPFVI